MGSPLWEETLALIEQSLRYDSEPKMNTQVYKLQCKYYYSKAYE